MQLDPSEWQIVSDPFEFLKIFRNKIPLIVEEGVGSVQLLITMKPGQPPELLACHTMKGFSIHLAELRLMKGDDIVTMGNCQLLPKVGADGYLEPPFFECHLSTSPEIRKFLGTHKDEANYRLKHPFHAHRGTLGSAGLAALRKAVEIVSPQGGEHSQRRVDP